MLKLKKIAVTGGLSCGKSSVCRFFKELGAYVINADDIVHKLLTPTTQTGQQVISLLGKDIVDEEGIDRSKIAAKVFQNRELLTALENILHPAVREESHKEYQKALASGYDTSFYSRNPLLFETGGEKEYDHTICVVANEEDSLKRFQSSTGYGKDEYQRRMSRQQSQQEKSIKAHFVINNNGSLTDLKKAVANIYNQLTSTI